MSQRKSTAWSHQDEQAVDGTGVITVAVAAFSLFILYGGGHTYFVPVLDHANLAFHEAGHVFFGIFGYTAGLYGGTLGQLVFPAAVVVSFLRRAAPVQAALGMLWFFQNLLNIARYAADARAQQLPLVGGGEHDWFNIFLRWNALGADTAFAATLSTIAWFGMLGTVAWLTRLWVKAR
ncbi:hypothetical protein HCU74_11170 [Spongiibacter sp. KMU-166]|uniref:Zinc ribbon domain-containing protein n=1 Tax=Spongiibacter thalassae TaxID=2721624 RepID=A0ABX1GHV7_9GAMM|nr:hypothetical protein [Spongiibacter thalassae]NKI17967.1 hypothetical protein [Spongiibacter thalassae]